MNGNEKARFHGIDEPGGIATRKTVREMLEMASMLASTYKSREIILVDLDTGECVAGRSIVRILLADDRTWNACWNVDIVSVRNDHGHISVIYNSGIEQEW